jgi:hypothetical protein
MAAYTLAALLSVASLGCTVPYFVGLHSDSTPYTDFGFYLRMAIVGLLAFNTLASWAAIKYLSRGNCSVAGAFVIAGCFGVAYNLLFGVRSASIAACQGTVARVCLEKDLSCAVTGTIRAWIGALYLLGLAATFVCHSYMLLILSLRVGFHSRAPASALVVPEEKQTTEITGNAVSFVEPGPRIVVTSESVGTAPEKTETPWTRK